MPLSPGSSREVVSRNIKEMVASGYPQRQAVAASLSNARRHPRSEGGATQDDTQSPPPNDHPMQSGEQRMEQIRQAMADPHFDWSSGAPLTDALRAYNQALQRAKREDQGKSGGGALDIAHHMAHRADGGAGNIFGGASPSQGVPWFSRREASAEDSGFLSGSGMGRTDYKNQTLPSGSYIIPSDVVSGLGMGNSLAGANLLDKMFNSEPYGIRPPPRGVRPNLPRAPVPREPVAKGGGTQVGGKHEPVDVILADGEFKLDPDTIAHHPSLGGLDPSDTDPKHFERAVKMGHSVLDHWVMDQRAKHVAEVAKLKGPVGAKKHPAQETLKAVAKALGGATA